MPTYPYPTVEDKVHLLTENGVTVSRYYKATSDPLQIIAIPGDQESVDAVIKIAKENGLWILSMSLTQEFNKDNEPTGRPYYEVIF